MQKILSCVLALSASALVASATPVSAKGCIKGAVVGAVAGHLAGKHAVAGAAVGCAVGHHEANKHAREDNGTNPHQ